MWTVEPPETSSIVAETFWPKLFQLRPVAPRMIRIRSSPRICFKPKASSAFHADLYAASGGALLETSVSVLNLPVLEITWGPGAGSLAADKTPGAAAGRAGAEPDAVTGACVWPTDPRTPAVGAEGKDSDAGKAGGEGALRISLMAFRYSCERW